MTEKTTAPRREKSEVAPKPEEKTGEPRRADEARVPAWTRSGKRPTVSMIKKALGIDGEDEPKILGKPLALGDGRFVAASHSKGATATVLLISERDGTAQVEGRIELPMEGYWNGYGEGPTIAAWEAGDLDSDGEPEAWLVLRWETEPEPAVGGSLVGEYIVIDPDPTFSIAFQDTTQILPEADTKDHLTATVRYADKNGDGHPDIHVRAKDCLDDLVGDDWKTICETTHSDYFWVKAADTWVARPEPDPEPKLATPQN